MPKTATPKIGLRATAGKRTLAFGLVRVGVSLGPAFDASGRVASNYICPEHGERVSQKYECGHGHDVKPEKAYPYGDAYVVLAEGEVPKAQGDDLLELQANVSESDISSEYVEKTHLMWPTDATHGDAYMLVLAYLRDNGRAFVSTTIDHGTTKAFVVRYSDLFGCLVAQVLNYHANVRWGNVEVIKEGLESIPAPDPKMAAMAESIFDSLPDDFAWEEVRDEYGEALTAAIAEKATTGGVTLPEDDTERVEKADSLMAALAASVTGDGEQAPAKDRVAV